VICCAIVRWAIARVLLTAALPAFACGEVFTTEEAGARTGLGGDGTAGSASAGGAAGAGGATSAVTTVGPATTSGGSGDVSCAPMPCAPGQVCCGEEGNADNQKCAAPGGCGAGWAEMACDGPEDCSAGFCCYHKQTTDLDLSVGFAVYCHATCQGLAYFRICHVDGDCPAGKPCVGSPVIAGYRYCKKL
jgi:hypothetical protein